MGRRAAGGVSGRSQSPGRLGPAGRVSRVMAAAGWSCLGGRCAAVPEGWAGARGGARPVGPGEPRCAGRWAGGAGREAGGVGGGVGGTAGAAEER